MLSVWHKHLSDAKEKEKFTDSLRHSRWILDRQTEILKEIEDDLNSSETSFKQYESPNWQFRQADVNGYRRCLKQIMKMNNLDPKETK